MSDPALRASRAIPMALEGPLPSPAAPAREGPGFRDALRAGEGSRGDAAPAVTADFLRDAARRIARGEVRIDQVIRQCERGGGALTNEQLIALQATVYRVTQEVELAAKLVDKLTGAVRQTLTSQQ